MTTGKALFDLSGRTALVTGSSGGLGFAMARGLAEAGATVVLNGRNEMKLKAAVETLAADGLDAMAAAFDVADDRATRAAFEDFDADGVVIDIVVNNAGNQVRKAIVDLTSEEWQRVIDGHLTAAFQVGREAAKRMIARGRGGKIVNIGSLMSERGRATVAPYAAAKGGMKLLTRAMAAEWAAHGIQANAIGPGWFVTDMTKSLAADPKFDEWVKARTPAGRWGRPEELVGAVVFLSSSASDFVNGHILFVDGGFLAAM